MSWWIVFQIGQWLAGLANPPQDYLVSDAVFFAQPDAQQIMNLDKPDIFLLDIALFQATNEARRQAGLPILQYDRALHQAAQGHAESMVQHDYTAHEDLYNLASLTLLKRVQKQTNRFSSIGENVGQYQTIDTPDRFGVRFSSRRRQYEYVDLENKQVYKPYTYASYARYAVVQWLNSPHHRANLLNPLYTHVGCAARLSARPFQERRAPSGRVVQNFGTQRLVSQAD
ncbi:CAP domain-containing protein [Spirosoma sp.]|uniref:CAP domain-containing protein n=1 Tax=Spirosoma sp. TaxID=1899569 RepID=UPI003B3A434B